MSNWSECLPGNPNLVFTHTAEVYITFSFIGSYQHFHYSMNMTNIPLDLQYRFASYAANIVCHSSAELQVDWSNVSRRTFLQVPPNLLLTFSSTALPFQQALLHCRRSLVCMTNLICGLYCLQATC